MKLIVHHHALVFQDEFGYWFPSFIGAWLDEILNQIEEVAYVGEMTHTKQENHDYLINKTNFKLLSIGIRGYDSWFKRRKRIKEIGIKYSSSYSHLLIRGITPKQYPVFKAFNKLHLSFLMVGSLKDSKPEFCFNYESFIVWFLYYLRRFQLKRISSSAKIFVNSPHIIKEFKSIMRINAEFIPTNTVQNSHFNSFEFRGFQDKPIILFCGRVVKEKGIEELVYAISELKKVGKFFKLYIVGSISNSYKLYLDNVIEKENLSNVVSYFGFVKFGDDLFKLYKLADIFVLPSYHEGFPHSIWEACSTSTPIITTKVGGIPGLVSDDDVFFTDVRSVISLRKSIEWVVENHEIAHQKAYNAFKIGKGYSIENCVSILIKKIEV